MADYLARKSKLGLSYKTDWGATGDIGGTLPASPAFTLLVDPAQIKSNPSVTREEMQLTSATGLIAERARSVTDYKSGLHRFGFGGPAIQDQLAHLFFLSLFKVTETDLTVPTRYQHAFVPWAETDIPDFTTPCKPNDDDNPNVKPPLASIILDWMAGHNNGATYFNDCILNTLSLALNVNNQGIARFLTVAGEFICGSITEDANGTDSTFPALPAITTYNNATAFTLTLAGTVSYSGCFKTYGLTINNNVATDCKTTGGRANNFRISPDYMVDFTIPCNETTDALAGGLLQGTEQTITLSTGTTQTAGYLNIVAKGALVNTVERIIENGAWVYKGQLKCELPSSGNSLAVTMCGLTQLINLG